MSVTAEPSQGLRLPAGRVTVLLGPAAARHAVLDALDPASARRPGGPACGVITVSSGPTRSADERLAALRHAAEHRPAIVLVARLTDGLTAGDRQTVLAQLRTLASTRGSTWPTKSVVGASGVRAVWLLAHLDTALTRSEWPAV